MILRLILLLLMPVSSSASDSPRRARARHPAFKPRIEDQSFVLIGGEDDWKLWISSNFPDTSKSWPPACAVGEKSPSRDQVTVNGDFNKNAKPTTLSIRTKDLPDGRVMVTALAVRECRDGKWVELLRLNDLGVAFDGERQSEFSRSGVRGYSVVLGTGLKDTPEMRISATPEDARGEGMSEAIDFFYLPDDHKYTAYSH